MTMKPEINTTIGAALTYLPRLLNQVLLIQEAEGLLPNIWGSTPYVDRVCSAAHIEASLIKRGSILPPITLLAKYSQAVLDEVKKEDCYREALPAAIMAIALIPPVCALDERSAPLPGIL